MSKRLLLILAAGVTMSGCFMAPLAFIGPAASGFSTASIIQSGVTTGASYIVQKSTGKSVVEHAIYIINKDYPVNKEILQQTYFPENNTPLFVAP